jgi:aminoglycoside phosphotransferase family enzyme/predicted kinase
MSTIGARLSELLRPAAFPHDAPEVRLIESHISWVLLAGAYAYKLRKPVDFGFLDFTTLERRREDCEAEIALNRRLCPDLYLGVVEVVERHGLLCVGGPGRAIEPAVKMRRLPEAGMLPVLLDRGAVGDRLMERLAQQLADFHASAATGPGVDEYGTPTALGANWTENFDQTERFVGRTIDAESRDALRSYVDEFLQTRLHLLEQRVRDGRIRDGHGDLHANSVCVTGRRLYLFDCIEFNARFRCADVAAEVAFLAMDLDHLGRADLAQVFVDAYVRRAHDPDLVAVLDFYKCYRAYVRGKVLSFRLDEPGLAPADADQIVSEAGAYFDLARSYTHTSAPLVLVTMGLPASGKSTVARAVARRLGLIHLSSDVVRKSLVGLQPTSRRSEMFEQGLYSRRMSQRTYLALRRQAARWLRRGHSVVLDATYGKPAERVALRHLARRAGARLLFIVCHADDATLRARLAARESDPHRVSDARLGLWPALRAAYVPPTETPDVVTVDTTQSLDRVLDQILTAIGSPTSGARRAA